MGQAAIQAGVPVDVRQETPTHLSFQASLLDCVSAVRHLLSGMCMCNQVLDICRLFLKSALHKTAGHQQWQMTVAGLAVILAEVQKHALLT